MKRSIKTRDETLINTGYFNIAKLDGTPFPPLLVRHGYENTGGAATVRGVAPGSESEDESAPQFRRRLLVARRQLLTNTGGVLKWHSEVGSDASLLTYSTHDAMCPASA